VRGLAALAKRLLKRETTLIVEFPDCKYERSDWLAAPNRRSLPCLRATVLQPVHAGFSVFVSPLISLKEMPATDEGTGRAQRGQG
jgi:hypothetical protein